MHLIRDAEARAALPFGKACEHLPHSRKERARLPRRKEILRRFAMADGRRRHLQRALQRAIRCKGGTL